jgi:(4S)-4-hydroxy-5-phosphonooxypentane-2,3-dione isomerase
MPKITLKGHILVPSSDLAAVLAALPTHIELTRQEAGCVCFEVAQDPDAKRCFIVYEAFVDRAAFEAHQLRVKLSEWGRVAASAQRHYQVTEGDGR